MIVLDTNVISELFKPTPDASVAIWIKQQPGTSVFTTAVTRGELFSGAHLMPDGRRKDNLLRGLNRLFDLAFQGRVLDFDSAAADAYARIVASRRAAGRRDDKPFDAMIAGIVRSHGATLATRNLRDFDHCGIALVDPWH